jgi:hypothetical protein
MYIGYIFFNFRVFFQTTFFQIFQNSGVQNVGLHNHVFEQTVDIITTATGELLHEKVFGFFIENITPYNFLLNFGSGTVLNLNTEVHLPVVIDNSGGDEPYCVEPWRHFGYYLVQNVDISNNLSG